MSDHVPSAASLSRVAAGLRSLELGSAAAQALVTDSVAAIEEYLLPRVEDQAGPLVVVVVGPSGSGKSTVVNSLARRRVTEEGPRRPTTVAPVAWAGGSLPGTLDGIRSRVAGVVVDTLRPPPQGLVVVDSPPPEATDESGRSVALQLVAVADAVMFVAGPTRYADAQGFRLLEHAADRGLRTIFVLNRLPDEGGAIRTDFAEKLARRRFLPRPDPELVVSIDETVPIPGTGCLEPEQVAGVAKELEVLADPQSRPDVMAQAVAGTLRGLRSNLETIRTAVIETEVRRVEMSDPMRAAYRRQARRFVAEVRSGALAAVPASDLAARLASVVARRAGLAAGVAAAAWESEHGAVDESLFGAARDTVAAAKERFEFWYKDLEDLPRRLGGGRYGRRKRRRLAGAVAAAVVDPEFAPDRRSARLLARLPGIVDRAREELAAEASAILDSDARRFSDAMCTRPPDGVLAQLTEDWRDE